MFSIHLTTFIKAPIDRVFNLCRNSTIFKKALNGKNETLTAGATDILVKPGDTLTIFAKHFGKTRSLTLRITEMENQQKFVEEQVKGDLKSYRHEHHFMQVENGTIVIDLVEMEEPRDAIGSILGKLFLKNYFEKILSKRNELVRQYAESDKWRAVMG
jgi:ligand-binding SRPBCC domain-containing protein